MAVLVITFTIFNDTWFAIASVQSQLFILELGPDTLEISLYALASCIFGVLCSIGFLFARPHIPLRLETWLLIGYGTLMLCPLWGIIGLADVQFGLKVSLFARSSVGRCELLASIVASCADSAVRNSRGGSSMSSYSS